MKWTGSKLKSSRDHVVSLLFVLCCFQVVLCDVDEEDGGDGRNVYHNQFAVHVPGGESMARAIAAKHGFSNLGQIGALDGHYLFEHQHVRKRSADLSHEHHTFLEDEPEVHWFEQQREHKRTKRDVQSDSMFIMPDPLFPAQWFLNHGAADGSDMNVLPAWAEGYTGKGVVVTILDDGIQTNHPDLRINYDSLASTDINGNDDDPMPQDNDDNKHGTRCAGEVAAQAFNDVCGVGVAYNASIGGVRMLDGMVNDAVEARALSLNPDHIDIYSASWGPEDDGKTVDGPGPLAKKAFINGVKYGRAGKGSIFVWASGNGGRPTDNCNCDGYTNSIFTLSISSASQGGRKPWYLEECSSTLATTYSSGIPSQDASITTVDQDARMRPEKLCTSAHTGTSASAPIAAGVCALALEANPILTWRDMQHIVVLSSNYEPLKHESGWLTNGVGKRYSHKFGYGLMDAAAMVNLAKVWNGVGRQLICETDTLTANLEIPSRSDDVARVSVVTGACGGTDKEISYLEHVQCKISLRYNPRGALHIVLTSPSGTKSSLLLPRPKDKSNAGFEDWPFLSVHFWGERPNGTWTLEVNPSPTMKANGIGSNGNRQRGILKKWKLFFYGTRDNPLERIPAEDQPFPPNVVMPETDLVDYNDQSPLLPSIIAVHPASSSSSSSNRTSPQVLISQVVGPDGCNAECAPGAGCTGSGAHECHVCRRYRFGDICVAECPHETYVSVEMTCQPCHRLCSSCYGPEPSQCLTCATGRSTWLVSDRATCRASCPAGYSVEKNPGGGGGGKCIPCELENCESCEKVGGEMVCLKCRNDLLLFSSPAELQQPQLQQCLSSCPQGYFINHESRRCEPCDVKCATCVGPLATQCSKCRQNTFYYERKCVASCPPGFHPDIQTNECVPCSQGCARCMQTRPSQCLECLPQWTISQESDGLCVPETNQQCDQTSFFDAHSSSCRACHDSCATCQGKGSAHCLTCHAAHRLHISTCVEQCPAETYSSESAECRHCPHACEACTSWLTCSKCRKGYVLARSAGSCVANCNENEVPVNGQCQLCHSSCRACNGQGSEDCLSCPVDRVLYKGKCLSKCPAGTYEGKHANCRPCHAACLQCFGPTADMCTSCPRGRKPVGDRCTSCRPSNYYDLSSSRCLACHSSCASCSGPLPTDCTWCLPPTLLHQATCVPCCKPDQSPSFGKDRCCECNRKRDQCLSLAKGTSMAAARKRSFREDVVTSSRSTVFYVCLLAGLSMGTVFGLRSYSKNKSRRGRKKMFRRRRSKGADEYRQIPLEPMDNVDDDDLDDGDSEDEVDVSRNGHAVVDDDIERSSLLAPKA